MTCKHCGAAILIIDAARKQLGSNQALWSMLHRAQGHLEREMALELRK